MPFPVAAAITGGAALAGQLFNAGSTGNVNRKNRLWQQHMYETQKNDNLKMWNLQNEYNSPEAMMSRFKAAGINPNMVVGSAGGSAGPVPQASPGSSSFEAPQIDLGSVAQQAFSSHYDFALKKAQLDNLKAQNTDIVNSSMLKAAQTMSTLAGGEKTKFQTQFLQDTAHITRAFMAEQANKMHYDQYQSQSAAGISDEKNALSLEEIKQRISNLRDTGKSIRLRNVLSDLEVDLRKQGLNPNDPIYMRMIGRILSSSGLNLTDSFK